MSELLTYVRRRRSGSKRGGEGYSLLASPVNVNQLETEKGKAFVGFDKENVVPQGKTTSARKDEKKEEALTTRGREDGRRSSSWIGRMLSYSSTDDRRRSNAQNTKKKSTGSSKYSRRVMPTAAERKKKAFHNFLQDMKDYFNQVDAYELLEESPAKKAVLESNAGNDVSYSSRRASKNNRRSSIVIRRESIQEYNLGPMRLSSKFDSLDTLAEADQEEERAEQHQDDSLGTIAEGREEDGGDKLVDTLDTILDKLHIADEAGSSLGPHLKQLLWECGQDATELGGIPSLDSFLSQNAPGSSLSIRKVGEGTFGEAFKLNNNLVLKVVPIDGEVLVNGEKQKTSEELYAEVVIHNCLKRLRCDGSMIQEEGCGENFCDSFIETHGISVCRGRYAKCLVEAWESWDECHQSENDHVGIFQDDQLYIVFVYSDGGEDLEAFQFRTFDEIRSMLQQVTMALAIAEEELKFEHRDLHWGNILLRRTPRSADTSSSSSSSLAPSDDSQKLQYVLRGIPILVDTSGLQVQIIDFTLSRLEAIPLSGRSPTKVAAAGEGVEGNKKENKEENKEDDSFVAFCDLSQDEWLFKGPKGDIQAETYRKMLKCVNMESEGNWAEFHPQNNVHWLTYLVDCVLMNKMKGQGSDDGDNDSALDALDLTSDQSRQLRQFRKACMKGASSHDLVWHDLFKDTWEVIRSRA